MQLGILHVPNTKKQGAKLRVQEEKRSPPTLLETPNPTKRGTPRVPANTKPSQDETTIKGRNIGLLFHEEEDETHEKERRREEPQRPPT